jgi:hypothetical protein
MGEGKGGGDIIAVAELPRFDAGSDLAARVPGARHAQVTYTPQHAEH